MPINDLVKLIQNEVPEFRKINVAIKDKNPPESSQSWSFEHVTGFLWSFIASKSENKPKPKAENKADINIDEGLKPERVQFKK